MKLSFVSPSIPASLTMSLENHFDRILLDQPFSSGNSWRLFILGICALSLALSGCGSEANSTATTSEDSTLQGASGDLHLVAMNPLYIAYNRSATDPTKIVSVVRERGLYEFEGLVQPEVSSGAIKSIVTGIGVKAIDRNGRPMKITLALRERRHESSTGLFTSDTRLIASTNVDLNAAQDFVIRNVENPNIVMTGLGLRLREGDITGLFLQRKSLSAIDSASSTMPSDDKMTFLQADSGWAVMGFYIRFKADPAQYDMTKPSDKALYDGLRSAFLEDTLFYSGQLSN